MDSRVTAYLRERRRLSGNVSVKREILSAAIGALVGYFVPDNATQAQSALFAFFGAVIGVVVRIEKERDDALSQLLGDFVIVAPESIHFAEAPGFSTRGESEPITWLAMVQSVRISNKTKRPLDLDVVFMFVMKNGRQAAHRWTLSLRWSGNKMFQLGCVP